MYLVRILSLLIHLLIQRVFLFDLDVDDVFINCFDSLMLWMFVLLLTFIHFKDSIKVCKFCVHAFVELCKM